jgi:rhodanese-related sulfurtransferase
MRFRDLKSVCKIGSLLILLVFLLGFSSPVFAGDRFENFKAKTKDRFPGVSWLSVEKLREWMEEKKDDELILFDVRSREEFEISHLKGAYQAQTLDKVRPLLTGLGREQLIVTYCSVGYRSAVLAEELVKIGFVNVYNLEGSLFEWANKGYPVFQNGKRVKKVHFYNFWWGMYLKKELWAW